MDQVMVREELERILASKRFVNAEKQSLFLRHVVESTLNGGTGDLKETLIGVRVFGRKPDYDPRSDSTVRVEAGKLRQRLREYYEDEGAHAPIVISIPKGSYRPEFNSRVRKTQWPSWTLAAGAISILAIVAATAILLTGTAAPASAPFAFLDVAACNDGMILAIHRSGDLYYYRHRWESKHQEMDNKGAPLRVGNGWIGFRRIGCVGEGRVLAINDKGRLLWYATPLPDGPWGWDVRSGSPIDAEWDSFNMVAFSPDGDIYGRRDDGSVFQSTLQEGGGFLSWGRNRERVPGNWKNCRILAAAGKGILYSLEKDGSLRWHRILETQGKRSLDSRSGTVIARDWRQCTRLISAPDGVLYCVSHTGELIWNRRDVEDPGAPWDPSSGAVSGGGFYLPR